MHLVHSIEYGLTELKLNPIFKRVIQRFPIFFSDLYLISHLLVVTHVNCANHYNVCKAAEFGNYVFIIIKSSFPEARHNIKHFIFFLIDGAYRIFLYSISLNVSNKGFTSFHFRKIVIFLRLIYLMTSL